MVEDRVLVKFPAGVNVGGSSAVRHRRSGETGKTFCGLDTFKLARKRRSLVGSAEKCDECFPGQILATDGGGNIEDPEEDSVEFSEAEAAAIAVGLVGIGVAVGVMFS